MTDAELEEIQSVFGFTDEQLESYLMKFYEGIVDEFDIPGGSQQSDLERRMSKAYDKLEAQLGKDNEFVSTNKSAADFIRMANRMRQERGEGAINVKGLDSTDPSVDAIINTKVTESPVKDLGSFLNEKDTSKATL